MTLSIITQNGEIVNYNNVISIVPTDVEVEDMETGKTISAFGLLANAVSQSEVQLGFFETEDELDKVYEKLEKWLTDCNYPIFRIPDAIE